MAERDTTTTVPAAATPRHLAGWLLLVVLCLTTAIIAVRSERRLDSQESAAVLAALSLVHDRDLIYQAEDRERLVALGEAARPALRSGTRFDVSPFFAAWLAPAAAVAPRGGAALAVVLALGLAAVALAVGLGARLGATAPWWAAAVVWGSGAYTTGLRIDSDALVLAMLATSLACAIATPRSQRSPFGDLYSEATAPAWSRVLFAGLLAGLAIVAQPMLIGAALALAPLLAARGVASRQRRVAAGIALGLGGGYLALGLRGWPNLDLELLGHNLLLMLAGPRFGLLVVALPAVVVLLGLGSWGEGRRWLFVAFAVALLLNLTAPFSWSGAPATIFGPLPILAVLLGFAVRRDLSRTAALVVLVVGQLLVASAWSPSVAVHQQRLLGSFFARLPWETTQPPMPGESETTAGELLLRSTTPALEPRYDGELLARGGKATLFVVAPARLERLVLRLSAEAPTDLPLKGAEVLETMFRADGGIDIVVQMGAPVATYTNTFGRPSVWHRLDLDLGRGGFTLAVVP